MGDYRNEPYVTFSSRGHNFEIWKCSSSSCSSGNNGGNISSGDEVFFKFHHNIAKAPNNHIMYCSSNGYVYLYDDSYLSSELDMRFLIHGFTEHGGQMRDGTPINSGDIVHLDNRK